MKESLGIIAIPVLSGLLLFLVPEKFRNLKGVISVSISLISGFLAIELFRSDNHLLIINSISSTSGLFVRGLDLIHDAESSLSLNLDNLSKLLLLLISLFAILILIYSTGYGNKNPVKNFYPYFLITLGCSYGAVLSDNMLLFLAFWGVLGLTLYKLIPGNTAESSAAAKKTLILIGASDCIMIIGIGIIWKISGSLSMSTGGTDTSGLLAATSFFALAAGSFTKAGAFPFHTWVPDYAQYAPSASTAYLPAALDKLLGIYFLARITSNIFILNDWLRLFLILAGVVSIITAVMMALFQHNYKRLLGFHAVSQVGYMILGFGLGSVAGMAAGLFHMINNAVYKSGLFLAAGCIEKQTGKEEIEDLGGLAKAMPLTFVSTLVFAVSISGIPPFNGFASKWMIYQGIIDLGTSTGIAGRLWFIWLGLAVLGSALTLASFIKLVGGIFLGRQKTEFRNVKEVSFLMWTPVLILAICCICTGVFATGFVVPEILVPAAGSFYLKGFWDSSLVSLMVLLSIISGIIIYLVLTLKKFRTEDSFIGGERIQDQTLYSAPEFYKTLTEFHFISWLYGKAEEKLFDIYDLSKMFVLWTNRLFSNAHTGILPGYVIWVFAGLIIMLLIMI